MAWGCGNESGKWTPNPDSWRYLERAESLSLLFDRTLGELAPDYSRYSPPGSPSPLYARPEERRTRSYDDLRPRPVQTDYAPDEDSYENGSEASGADAARNNAHSSSNELPSTALCPHCQGITIETITAETGYHHSSLKSVSSSAAQCKLCRLILDAQGSKVNTWVEQPPDRYQISISLQMPAGDASVKDRHNRQTGAVDLWIATTDTTPEKGDPLYAGGGKFGKIEYTAYENGHAVVRGRPLSCFTLQHDPAADAGIHWVRQLSASTASDRSFDIAQSWLQQCLSHKEKQWNYRLVLRQHWDVPDVAADHAWSEADVSSEQPVDHLAPERPTRLVDLQPKDAASGQVRLIETALLARSTPRALLAGLLQKARMWQPKYATLSYCWGFPVAREWLTTKGNLRRRLNGFSIASLPLTVRDSFTIASKMSVRYIWVDALCILQNDELDWAKESAKMAGIYRGSLVTIAASAASSVNDGCFNSSSISRFDRFNGLVGIGATLSDGRKSSIYVYGESRPDLFERDVTHGALARRAWTFQEQMLSRRTIYYGASQLIWDCEHCRLTEDNFPLNIGDPLYPVTGLDRALTGASLLQLWYVDAVAEFARRNITCGSDKLVAISALAKATYLNKHVEYCAGLWKDTIMTGLMWRRRGKGCKSEQYRCPSWSWASQDSAVSYELATNRRFRSSDADAPPVDESWHGLKAKVIEIETDKDRNNIFGVVTGGFVRLHTYVTTGRVLRDNFGTWSFRRQRALIVSVPGKNHILQGVAHLDDNDSAETHFACALLAEYGPAGVFLLLHPPHLGAERYVRKGIVELGGKIMDDGPRIEELARSLTPATVMVL